MRQFIQRLWWNLTDQKYVRVSDLVTVNVRVSAPNFDPSKCSPELTIGK